MKSFALGLLLLTSYAVTRKNCKLLHIMAALVFAALTVNTGVLTAQQSRTVLKFDSVHTELSVMASLTFQTRREQSRCITRYRIERDQGRLIITILALGPAEVVTSDSTQVWFYATRVPWDTTLAYRVCGDSLPGLHSHIALNGYLERPSEVDLQTALHHPAPFHLLMSVMDSSKMGLRLYGVRGVRGQP